MNTMFFRYYSVNISFIVLYHTGDFNRHALSNFKNIFEDDMATEVACTVNLILNISAKFEWKAQAVCE